MDFFMKESYQVPSGQGLPICGCSGGKQGAGLTPTEFLGQLEEAELPEQDFQVERQSQNH